MPIYEYRCTSCGHEFSKLEKMTSESQSVECPSCHEPRADRQFSTFASSTGAASGPSCPAPAGGCGSGFS